MDAATLIKSSRLRAGLTQDQLARRMSTTQAAIARLERSGADPRVSTVARALRAVGEQLALGADRAAVADLDVAQLRAQLKLSPAERAEAHDRAHRETRAMVNAARAGR